MHTAYKWVLVPRGIPGETLVSLGTMWNTRRQARTARKGVSLRSGVKTLVPRKVICTTEFADGH